MKIQVVSSQRRNIPAYAGKTSLPSHPGEMCPEHPRVCGENPALATLPSAAAGTSPRMRGKRGENYGLFPWHRNIPAYAGKTLALEITQDRSKEHPRVCGENFGYPCGDPGFIGTSPRMRGKPKRIA